jgi:hypothetical protein
VGKPTGPEKPENKQLITGNTAFTHKRQQQQDGTLSNNVSWKPFKGFEGGQPRRKFRGKQKDPNKTQEKKDITGFRKMINDPGFTLQNDEKSVIFGCLLTDGTLQKRGNSFRMRVSHCTKHRSLVQWQYERLKRLCETTQPPKVVNNGAAVEFYTSSALYLSQIHSLFYEAHETTGKDGKKTVKFVKTITPELIAALPKTPEFLALVWCCDGSARTDCYAGRLALHCFCRESQQLFVDWLFTTYGIEATVVRHTYESQQYQVSIPAKSFSKFVEIVEPVISQIPALRYKLNEIRKTRSKYL